MKKFFFILFLFPIFFVQAQDDSLKNVYSISEPTLSKLRVICKDWEKADSAFKFASLYSRVKDIVDVLQIEIQDRTRSLDLGYKEPWMKIFNDDLEAYSNSFCNFIDFHPESFPGIQICRSWSSPFPTLSISAFKVLADSTVEVTDNDFCNFLELAYGENKNGTEYSANWNTNLYEGMCNSVILGDEGIRLMLELSLDLREEAPELIPLINDVMMDFLQDVVSTKYFFEDKETVMEELNKLPPYYNYDQNLKKMLERAIPAIDNELKDLIFFDAGTKEYKCGE